jgi:chitinase
MASQQHEGPSDTMTPTTLAPSAVSTAKLAMDNSNIYSFLVGQYPETLVAAGYTHINAAYPWIDPDNFTVAYTTGTDNDIWSRLTALKETNPGLQVWLSIGGWMMNGGTPETLETFESLVSHTGKEEQERFTESLLSVMEEFGFDGVEFDWYVSS